MRKFHLPEGYGRTIAVITCLGLLTGLLDIRYALGFGLGALASILLYFRNDSFWSDVLDTGTSTKYTGIFHFLINYLIMAGVLLAGAFLPQFFNIFACAAGLMLIKISVIVKEAFPNIRKGGKE